MKESKRWKIADEILSVYEADGIESIISSQTLMAVSNEHYLYYVQEESNGSFVLKSANLENKTALSDLKDGPVINKPISMTISDSAVAIVDEDHHVQIYVLETGSLITFAPQSELTKAAAYTNGLLLTYSESETSQYVLKQSEVVDVDVFSPEKGMIAITTQKPDAMSISSAPAPTPSLTDIQTAVTANPAPTSTVKHTQDVQKTATPNPSNEDSSIRMWNTGKKVRKMQQRLSDLGYPVGTIDGSFGNQTLFAVNLFQDIAGFTEHSYMSEKMLNRLYSNNAPVYDACYPLSKGDRGILVKLMQEALYNAGYDPGKIDGIYGKKTVIAVQNYQVANQIRLAPMEVPGEHASKEMLALLYNVIVIIPQPMNPSEPIVITPVPVTNQPIFTPRPTNNPATPTNSPVLKPDQTENPASKTDL